MNPFTQTEEGMGWPRTGDGAEGDTAGNGHSIHQEGDDPPDRFSMLYGIDGNGWGDGLVHGTGNGNGEAQWTHFSFAPTDIDLWICWAAEQVLIAS